MKFQIVVNDGSEISSFDLENAVVSLGRASDNDIQLNDKYTSRNHLILWGEKNRFFVKDLGSKTGTYINGRQILLDLNRRSRDLEDRALDLVLRCIDDTRGQLDSFRQVDGHSG